MKVVGYSRAQRVTEDHVHEVLQILKFAPSVDTSIISSWLLLEAVEYSG